jgi:hypothetical protein
MRAPLLSAILAATLLTPAAAHEPRRQHGAHSHGEGRLSIAIDGTKVALELEAPAHDIVGFEHAPSNAAQRKALADAKARLEKASEVIGFPAAAGCTLASAKVEISGAAGGAAPDGAKGHAHDKAKAGGKADGHGDHSEFHATYAFECATPAALRTLSFPYFKSFKKADRLDVTIIGPGGQSSSKVGRRKPTLEIRGAG